MSKQTAVEWLYNHLFPNQLDGFSEEEWSKIDKAFKQAKEMENQQHKETFEQSRLAKIFIIDRPPVWESWERYYNQTSNTKQK